jgi:RNA polymerase sigma-70 factor (ECF subfamily)
MLRMDPEQQILNQLDAERRDDAVTLALRTYGPQIYGYLVALIRDRAVADDAFAEFSEDLWEGLGGFRRECSIRTYAYRLALHAALRLLREPHRRRGRRLETEEIAQIADRVRTSTAAHLRTSSKDKLAELRAALSPEEQTLLILRIDRNLPWREVAEVMAIDEPAARKRFERTKERLRDLARKSGLVPR